MTDAQEPVGVVDEGDDGLFVDLETPSGVMVKRGDKLYTAPRQLTPPEGWADAVKWATLPVGNLSREFLELKTASLDKAVLDMNAKLREHGCWIVDRA